MNNFLIGEECLCINFKHLQYYFKALFNYRQDLDLDPDYQYIPFAM